jgi:glycine dehydrogenase
MQTPMTLIELEGRDEFVARHIGPNATEQAAMCAAIGVKDRAELIAQTVPAGIRLPVDLPLGD